jgi:hypothetical protein
LMSSDLMVSQQEGQLTVQLRSGEVFDILDAFSELLLDLVIDAFDIFAPADHLPRVNFDRVVIQRECWWFDAAELPFVQQRDEVSRFWATRRWLRQASLPTQVFVTSPMETKPIFIDFDSPTFVEMFAKLVRRVMAARSTGRIKISEMLPSPEQLWLTDAAGNHYTSELRMVASDTRPVPGPTPAAHTGG